MTAAHATPESSRLRGRSAGIAGRGRRRRAFAEDGERIPKRGLGWRWSLLLDAHLARPMEFGTLTREEINVVLYRKSPAGRIAISQPAHAWLSGQLARAWGNERFGAFEPWEDVCLAAEQHDAGWADWEEMPTLNRQTGLPHTFMELPATQHTVLWTNSIRRASTLGRYVALLVTLHGTGLYERYPRDRPPPEARAAAEFLAREHAFLDATISALQGDSRYDRWIEPAVVARNRRLISVWDWLSLLICGGIRGPQAISEVPDATGDTMLALTPMNDQSSVISVAPWPFQTPEISLACEGRLLLGTFDNEQQARAALASARFVSITTTLIP